MSGADARSVPADELAAEAVPEVVPSDVPKRHLRVVKGA